MNYDLIKKIKKGDKEAFRELYDIHFEKALRTAVVITKNKEMSKDAVQETFIRVYLNISSYNIEKPFEPWFYRILINECNRLLKKRGKINSVDFHLLENSFSDQKNNDFTDLYESILSLNDIYKIPVILKYLQGFAEKEIASILDLKLNTVKSRLFKGREKLKIALEALERR